MRHLVIVAHPAEDSLTMRVARIYAAELERLKHTQCTYDLYRMGFNPVLGKEEVLPAVSGSSPSPDIISAQNDVSRSDVLTIIYPLWWLSMPAILKGYVDRVFARGFAYESDNGVVRGLLAGKKAVLITLSGAPLPLLMRSGNWNAVQVLQDTHIFRAVGFELLEHLHFDNVVPHMANEIGAAHLQSARLCAQTHFG
jgi:NAD(P)H dehydrogenase (quinone)